MLVIIPVLKQSLTFGVFPAQLPHARRSFGVTARNCDIGPAPSLPSPTCEGSGQMSLIRLVYASKSRLVEANRREEIDRILATARSRNRDNEVTGFLLATPGAFAQVLEGSAHHVAETYGRIVVDPRHGDMRVLAEHPIPSRDFTGWSMGLAEHDETTQFIFGLYGVTPEADLSSKAVDALLDLAGELARQRG
jgi:hypothetical protein